MKTIGPFLFVFLALAATASAQDPTTPPPSAVVAPTPRTAAELEQLLAPIALYPDALVALILPASTAPADIVLAARQMRGTNNDRSQVESRAWDDSVKSLTHYPDVLNWMDENLEWTKQVGEAFLAEPAEVMNTLQRLRARAQSTGMLANTPQQQVISTGGIIRIVPAQRDVIYVPYYEPSIIYVDRPTYYPTLTFGMGFPVGSWLAYDCDWVQRRVWVGDRHRHWRGHDWQRPLVTTHPGHPAVTSVRHWQPRSRPARPVSVGTSLPRAQVITPVPYSSARSGPRTGPATHPQAANNLPRTFRSGSPRELPGPHTAVPATPPPARAPAFDRQENPGSPRNPEPRGRSLPNVIGGNPLPVAPPLRMVLPSLPMTRGMGPYAAPDIAPSLPAHVAPSLPNVAPSLPAVVPSFPEAPTYQNPPPASNNHHDPGERQPRRGSREQLN